MLKLRRGTVVDVTAARPGIVRLVIEVAGAAREAYAETGLVGDVLVGDEVVINVEAVDLALGSGGADVVVANLSRGLAADADPGAHVMKQNYTPIQHGVSPVELEELGDLSTVIGRRPVAVFQLHAQLPCIVWAALDRAPGLRIGYVQTAGGALGGAFSDTVRGLLDDGRLIEHVTAGAAYGGASGEAITTIGALHAGFAGSGWDAAVVGPGPGILGSATALGHGGLVALDSAHAALSLGCETIMAVRASSGDPRERHRGISHHTTTVLDLLLRPVTVAVAWGTEPTPGFERHRVVESEVDLDGYARSGLPASTMGRSIAEDEAFFRQALAAGVELGHAAGVASAELGTAGTAGRSGDRARRGK